MFEPAWSPIVTVGLLVVAAGGGLVLSGRLELTGRGRLVTIDLSDPCITPAASPVHPDGRVDGLKTVTWARQNDMAVAVNASFFFPYDQSRFWDVYPNEGDPVTILGPTVAPIIDQTDATLGPAAKVVSDVAWDGHAVSIDPDGRAAIGAELVAGATWAVSGKHRLLADGSVVAPPSDPYPRTVVGVDAQGETMWWLVVDGKQPGYSEGVTLAEAARLLASRGADDALELDGGGSSTMVADRGDGPELLSRPMQVRIPGRSRVVANSIGLAGPSRPDCR